ncbi:Cytochrome c oxidase polypeptide II [Minicystis rosea]|nr:Cytochrome c oxidase polypeptide II [Minicystis rosea]
MNEILRRILFLPPQDSTIAHEIDALHYFVILTTMAGATLVTLVGAYFLVRYRLRQREADPPNPHADAHPHFLYKVAALIGLCVLFLVWWFIGVRQYMRLRVAPADAMDVYVTGKKWMWKFAYPEGARSIGVLYVPVGRPVKLIMTSRDVIHSFFVPSFRVKQDVLPGRYTTMWFQVMSPGTYQILCTEYCGTGHSTMLGEVVALSPDDYGRWLGGTPAEPGVAAPRYVDPAMGRPDAAFPRTELSLARMGERVAAEQGCLRCHSLDGSPHIGPTWAGLYQSTVPLENGKEVLVDDAYLTESMMDPGIKIHRGFQAVMPSYLGKLDGPQIAAIVDLIRSLRDVRPEPGARTPTEAVVPPADRDRPGASRPEAPRPPPPSGRPAPPPFAEPPGGRIPPQGEKR